MFYNLTILYFCQPLGGGVLLFGGGAEVSMQLFQQYKIIHNMQPVSFILFC